MKDCDRTPTRGRSVKDDWRAWLPAAKAQVFDMQVHRLESSYVMLSVSLDEALELRHLGHPGKSLLAVGITSGLCRLLTSLSRVCFAPCPNTPSITEPFPMLRHWTLPIFRDIEASAPRA